ncbi:MAG TPA: hypothetical protein DEO70_12170 [Bacteroidales bacterium]|nr:MAG: hypothetical protein A2X11_10160 [Bacteroidetes bacterium GWE2_42_24]OFY25874.1 MAG: hypothetical protein A2X09_09535 [Bacteroidetes bacterium GWF2_43_11]HBZ67584.1 hypothetical protein [Bacteroidales bacterium]
MYVKANVLRPAKTAPGSGGDKKDTLILFDFDDLADEGYHRSGNGVITDQLVFKPGKYMVKVYGTVSKMKGSYETEGDEDAEGFMHGFEFEHPGDAIAIMEFVQNWTGKNVGAITQKCSENYMKQYGTPCSPLKLKSSGQDDKDANVQKLVFKNTVKAPFVPGKYEGTLTLESVLFTVAADSDSINLVAGSGQYQLTSGVGSVALLADLENASDGLIFTLLGSGGTYPSKIESPAGDGSFLLQNGVTWIADAGSQITFRVMQTGVLSYKAIEISRS